MFVSGAGGCAANVEQDSSLSPPGSRATYPHALEGLQTRAGIVADWLLGPFFDHAITRIRGHR
jgi:hypothetical protein